MPKLTKIEDIRQTSSIVLDPEIYMQALHCAHCIDDLINNPLNPSYQKESPEEYGQYEAKHHKIEYPDGTTAGIVALWCKRCKKLVWDSRHLIHKY
jgi:hypothetical protein